MKIKVKYFASLREQSSKNEEEISTTLNTPLELYKELKEKYNFTLDSNEIKVAINGEYQEFHTSLLEGDVVTFIPPVAGG